MEIFDQAFSVVVGVEGGYTNNPADPRNWTAGKVGVGECRGTKFGISAAAYPNCDIVSLPLDQAKAIYRADYWNPLRADELPPSVALLVFDAAVNHGVLRATAQLQAAIGVAEDGQVGPATLEGLRRAVGKGGVAGLCVEVQVQRLLFMSGLPTWPVFRLGWSRRICRLMYQSLTMGET